MGGYVGVLCLIVKDMLRKHARVLLLGGYMWGDSCGFSVGVGMMVFMRKVVRKRNDDDPDGNKWAKSIKGAKTIKLSLFENLVSKMRLSYLMKATNTFSKDNIIGLGRTGCL